MANLATAESVAAVPLSEGGHLWLERAEVSHLHVEIDDETRLFGLAVPAQGAGDPEMAHVLEHLVMRQDVAGVEVATALQLHCSTRWWHGMTTAQCVSFEVASYTDRCYHACASLLSAALFGFRVTAERLRSETDPASGRVSAEHASQPGLRRELLDCVAQALLGRQSEDSHPADASEVESWHAARVRPENLLWYTYGPISWHAAKEFVAHLVNALPMRSSAASHCVRETAASSAPLLRLPARFPGPVIAWKGPSQRLDPLAAACARFLHSAVLHDREFHKQVRSRLGVNVWTPASTYFGDHDTTLLTFGLTRHPENGLDPALVLGELWRERAPHCVQLACEAIDRWLIRQYRYYADHRGARPYGSQVFSRVRETALAGGDVALVARSDRLARMTKQQVAARATKIVMRIIADTHGTLHPKAGTNVTTRLA